MSKTDRHPFSDLRALVKQLPGPDAAALARTRARERELTKPLGSLGRLEGIGEHLAAWQGRSPPRIDRPVVAIFAASHGVTAQGVSAFPSSVNAQMVANFRAGGAAINQLAALHGAGLKVFELALDFPTPDITEAEAMTAAECAATIAFGMEAIIGGADCLVLGEMGIGNTTIAAAIAHGLFGGTAADWVGRGTGLDEAGLRRKEDVVARAVERHRAALGDPLETLRCLGGREIAALVGALLAARVERIPVLLDGYVVGAAAAVAHALEPTALDHCLAGHVSAEPGHRRLLERIGLEPILDLGMRLGEASGAAVALGVLRAACAAHSGMATFAEAGVDGPG